MRSLLFTAAILFAGCASEPPVVGADRPVGPPLEVRLMPDRYVELAGERMTLEAFVYRTRVACRRADATESARPWLNVVAPKAGSAELGNLLNEIRNAAYDAGIQHIELSLQ